ncbi:MAG TPA: hypothetical protein VK699_19575 [Terriglobales bacterium]|jgi:hypothetical protein|nr:hypothetical protein [Terriglobales bacterium]
MNPIIKLFMVAGRPVLGGAIVFLLLVGVYQLSLQFGITGWQSIWDDFAGGVLVGVLLYIDDRRRRRYLAERLQTIALMNHHVRNALQAIKYARYTPDDVQVIEDSVSRIEWALREILPGKDHIVLNEAAVQ